MEPVIDIIIPTFRDQERAVHCAEILEPAIESLAGVRAIIVDNEGDPKLEAALRDYRTEYLLEKQPGSYAARNFALKQTHAPIVAFTDSDCSPRADWVTRAISTLDLHQADIVVGPVEVYTSAGQPPNGWEVIDMIFNFPIEEWARVGNWGVTANLIARRKCFEKVGLFDGTLLSGGDSTWCKLAVSQGFKLVYDSELVVRHPSRSTMREHFTKTRRIAGGSAERARKDGSIPSLFKVAILSLLPPVNKWRKIWSRKDIHASGRLSGMLLLVSQKYYYSFSLLKAIVFRHNHERS